MTPFIALAGVLLLLVVVLRLFQVGCRLIVYAFYFALLVLAASILYSILRQGGALP